MYSKTVLAMMLTEIPIAADAAIITSDEVSTIGGDEAMIMSLKTSVSAPEEPYFPQGRRSKGDRHRNKRWRWQE